jgi:hypothetical protein
MNSIDILEAAMMVCFGIAWPIANLKMIRSGRAEGKGCAFTLIIACGYACGTLAKVVAARHGSAIPPVFWLYLLNTASVLINLALQWRYRTGPAQQRSPALGAGDPVPMSIGTGHPRTLTSSRRVPAWAGQRGKASRLLSPTADPVSAPVQQAGARGAA